MAETVQRIEQSNIPDYARPYVESLLGRTHALTDINQNPYQSYGGQRVQGPTALQSQSYEAARGMKPAWQIGQATNMATAAGNAAQQVGRYNPGSFSANPAQIVTPPSAQAMRVGASPWAQQVGTQGWSPQAMGQYMNPYQQAVTDIAKREAARQSAMGAQQDSAAAVGAGAFGGSRHAIVQAERERNLGQQMNDIQMQGSNAAYNNAQQMFTSDQGRFLQAQGMNQGANLTAAGQNLQGQMANQQADLSARGLNLQGQMANQQAGLEFGRQNLSAQQMGEQSRQFGANMGLQGLQQQLAAAGMLGNLGQSQYNQQIGIAGLQNQFGTQQQATSQAILDHQYQDWQNRQNYPFRMLEFQNNIIRGNYNPQMTTSMNQPSPSPLSQMVGLGTAAAGFGQLMGRKKGGMVKSKKYAGGGITDVLPKRESRPKSDSSGAGLADLLIAKIA